MIPLVSPRDRFCPAHSHKKNQCFVEKCEALAQPGQLSCAEETHRALEVSRQQRNRKTLKELRRRLAKAGVPAVAPAGGRDMCVGDPECETAQDIPDNPAVPESSHSQNPAQSGRPTPAKAKGRTSRKYTHNEQLYVKCCGIIVSRATFYNAEGVAAVKVRISFCTDYSQSHRHSQDFLKATFPEAYPGAIPSYIFFDKNCQLLKHLIASGDHYFDHTGLPVDVFHASNCHHETDTFCNVHCNPAKFEELIDPTQPNGWRFNSSAAEQANAWFGGFASIVREMPICKYVRLF